MEGSSECRRWYLGGLSIQMDFPSDKYASDFLTNVKETWKDWFSSLNSWDACKLPTKRTALLEIHGLPIHVWNRESFIEIGSLWGDVVYSEDDDANGIRKTSGHVGILTTKEEWILKTVTF